eukprot:6656277-Prymnesium_polylepis.1
MEGGNVKTFAGNGFFGMRDGQGMEAQFYRPGAVAVGNLGDVFVADTGNNAIRHITPDGVVSTLWSRVSYVSGERRVYNATLQGTPPSGIWEPQGITAWWFDPASLAAIELYATSPPPPPTI